MAKINFKSVLSRRGSEQSAEIKELEQLAANAGRINGPFQEEELKREQDQRLRRRDAELTTVPSKKSRKNTITSEEREMMKDTFNVEVDQGDKLLIERFIDGLNFGEGPTNLLKLIIIPVSERIISSKYINTESTGQLHLQSFGIGVMITSFMAIIQPFLMFYLDGWILFLGKLFKHLVGWVILGCVISYVLNNKKGDQVAVSSNPTSTNNGEIRENRFKQLQYTVKKSRSNSPQKKQQQGLQQLQNKKIVKVNPYLSRRSSDVIYDKNGPVEPSSEQMLIQMTERAQYLEKARMDVDNSRSQDEFSNYDKFMDIALKKDREVTTYNKFVDDNRQMLNNTKEAVFGDA